ncbi:MAG TPA: PepSY domain-containing protein [Methylophilaceae bacterium]|nr:PepSY domain-containing protein [Methylophilaceae bacterium]
MRALVLTHRWLGIASCLLFAMWFATGLVMHFVPFPALTPAENFAGLSPIQTGKVQFTPEKAAQALDGPAIRQVQLIMRSERPQYVFRLDQRSIGIYADNGELAAPVSRSEAISLAQSHARNRGLDANAAQYAELVAYDQWTVPNGLDSYRPLHRIKLHDAPGTELYVSDLTGEVVRDTTRFERGWNYVGSVLHWIYPTALRKHWGMWDSVVWWLALLALIGALSGLMLGVVRTCWASSRLSPFQGMQFWHHMLGLGCAIFVLTYIFSGWLSMDHGLLFSKNTAKPEEIMALAGGPYDIKRFDKLAISQAHGAREIDFIQLGSTPYLRARMTADDQVLISEHGKLGMYFSTALVTAASQQLLPDTACAPVAAIPATDTYYVKTSMQNAPLYRAKCVDASASWFQIDSASGRVIEKTDYSRRWYRWLYSGLHTFDIPWFAAHSGLRTGLILALCSLGFIFSVTGIIIGWRRSIR